MIAVVVTQAQEEATAGKTEDNKMASVISMVSSAVSKLTEVSTTAHASTTTAEKEVKFSTDQQRLLPCIFWKKKMILCLR